MRIPESSKEFPIPQVITKLRTDTLKWVRRTISLYPVSLSPKPAQLSTGRGHLSLPPLLGGGGRRRMEYVCNFPALWKLYGCPVRLSQLIWSTDRISTVLMPLRTKKSEG